MTECKHEPMETVGLRFRHKGGRILLPAVAYTECKHCGVLLAYHQNKNRWCESVPRKKTNGADHM